LGIGSIVIAIELITLGQELKPSAFKVRIMYPEFISVFEGV
jgi:hypothetical protein